ncbi:ROK family transcriptional regulator [Cryptosporangium aurantiacum]|uniref:ROK family transcriptional regulator n=1 Tax=Cryptosporangium aurantiacum TaxID=134849 RepID=UPI001C4A06F1|nr:ROK family transcriptional regulator [Cryptosporangium aurantiacum]
MSTERIEGLAAVLTAVRNSEGMTQPRLTQHVGLGRSVVAQRVAELESAGLITDDGYGPSTGGRAPRRLRIRAEAGYVVGVDITAQRLVVGVADLAGTLLAQLEEVVDVADGPDAVLTTAERLIDDHLESIGRIARVWAIGIGVPGPVEFRTGQPVAPPIMPGWDRYPVRDRLAQRYGAPAWLDNDVNLLALAELRTNPAASAARNMLYMRADVGVGAGLVVKGELYRGANGSAGDIGHVAIPEGGDAICRCGNTGCLEAVAGGAALAREGRMLADTRQSPALAATLAETGTVRPLDVTLAAEKGDPAARALLQRSAHLLGGMLATLVSFYNPNLLVIGGGIVRARAHVLAAIREAIYRRSLPLATQDLRIEMSSLPDDLGGVTGAVHLALDEVFSPGRLARWLDAGSPAGQPYIATDDMLERPA